MIETIDLNLVRAFAAVADAGGFTRAAKRLDMSRATLSRQIAQLERTLGVRLFHRTTRRVSLSTAGAALHERVTRPLVDIEEAARDLPEAAEQPGGQLRITAPADLATALLPAIIARFVEAHPAISVELSVSNTFVDLVAGGFDCALRISTRRLRDSSLVARRVGNIGVQLFASSSYLNGRRRPRGPASLAGHDWVVAGMHRPLKLTSGRRTIAVKMHGRIETDDMLFTHQAVVHGCGIGVLPRFLAAEDVRAGRLECVLPRWRAKSAQLWMLWPGGRHVPLKTRAFHDAVAASLPAD